MKKTIIFMVLSFVINLHSQWLGDVRLTNDPSESVISNNNSKSVASNGQHIHIVWKDIRDGNEEIYYKRSTNSGISWGNDTRLTINSSISKDPAISSSGQSVFVSWVDTRDGNNRIYFKRSTDDGASWFSDFALSNTSSLAFSPSMDVSGNTLLVVWGSIVSGNYQVNFKRSPDAGYSWASEVLLNSGSFNGAPSISCWGQDAAVCWSDNRDGNEEIYFCKTTDLGINWSTNTRLTNDPSQSTQPSISIEGRFFYVTWVDMRNGNKEIYLKISYNYGGNWYGETRLTTADNESSYPNIASFGEAIHLVWEDYRHSLTNSEIFYKISTNRGANWGIDTRLTNNASLSVKPHIDVSGSNLNVIWHDFRNGAAEIYYKRNPTGNPIGIQQISSEVPSGFNLSQNYPNPFNPTTNIKISVPKSEFVNLTVYDITGKEADVLVNENLNAGVFNVDFNASHLASGTYFYRIAAGSFSEVKKMILVK